MACSLSSIARPLINRVIAAWGALQITGRLWCSDAPDSTPPPYSAGLQIAAIIRDRWISIHFPPVPASRKAYF